MAVEHVLAQKSKESAKWTTQVANINEYVSVNAAKLSWKNALAKSFFL